MELTLKRLLEQAEFAKAKRGYDADEVDEFLDRAVAMAAKVEVRLTQALEQAKGAGSAPGGPAPADVEAEVERRVQARLAEQPAPDPDRPSGASEEEAAEEVRRTIVLAQRTADAAVREAREDAARLLDAARERAEALTDEADNALTVARQEVARQMETERRVAQERLAAEVGELEGIREALRSDVTVLDRHVTEQRDQLRSSVGELQRVLDDPAGFRLAPTPALLDPDIPSPIVTAGTDGDESGGDRRPPTDRSDRSDRNEAAPSSSASEDDADTGTGGDEPGRGSSDRPEPRSAGTGAPTEPDSLSFDDVDHAAPGVPEATYGGPPTAPVSAVDLGVEGRGGGSHDEDAFLTELRKAMSDDEPLGPRQGHAAQEPSDGGPDFGDDEGRGWRFGKRR